MRQSANLSLHSSYQTTHLVVVLHIPWCGLPPHFLVLCPVQRWSFARTAGVLWTILPPHHGGSFHQSCVAALLFPACAHDLEYRSKWKASPQTPSSPSHHAQPWRQCPLWGVELKWRTSCNDHCHLIFKTNIRTPEHSCEKLRFLTHGSGEPLNTTGLFASIENILRQSNCWDFIYLATSCSKFVKSNGSGRYLQAKYLLWNHALQTTPYIAC